MLRIFIVKNSSPGAPLPLSVYLTGFLENLHPSRSHEFYTITAPPELHLPRLSANITRQFHIRASLYSVPGNVRFALASAWILLREHRRSPIHLIHCFYPNSSLLGAVIFKLLSRAQVPILYDVRSPWIEMIFAMKHLPGWLYGPVRLILSLEERFLLRFTDHILFVSRGLESYYRQAYRIPATIPSSVLGSAVDLRRFSRQESNLRSRLGLGASDIILGYTGTFTAARKLDEFFQLLAAATQDNPRVHLVMVGTGEQESDLRNLSKTLGIMDRVHFLGAQPHEAMPEIVSGFDFGICHYPDELVYRYNHPLKILEFLASGVPVLASDTPAHREFSEECSAVTVYKTAENLADALNNNRQSPPLDVSKYSWRTSVNTYLQIYAGLITKAELE